MARLSIIKRMNTPINSSKRYRQRCRIDLKKEKGPDMEKVYVLFWFDVEDYITPQSDDALKRLAEIFDHQGAKATPHG